jgi:predicted acetyltransferase
MTYRPITEEEIPIFAEIQARAFTFELDRHTERLQEGGRVDWGNLRVLENEHAQPVAALTIFQRKMSLNGGEVPTGLVAGVAVPPDQRRRGYARSLLTGLLQELYEQQLPISLLFPFSVRYYRGLGYALVNLNWFLDIPPQQLPEYPERMTVRRATHKDLDAIRACYEQARCEPNRNGWLARNDWDWENRVWKQNREAVVCPAEGEIEGYLFYELNWSRQERPVKIAEWVSTTDGAWRGLVGFLSSLSDQATVITYNAPQNDPLLLALHEPNSTVGGAAEFVFQQAARLVSGFMLRVVHLSTALSARRYPPDLSADLLLRVDDPQLPGNSQPVHVHIVNGTASVAPARGLFPGELPTGVETDIATFSQLFVGFISAEQARTMGRLRADDATCALLTRAFSAAALYLHRSDWF